MCGVFAIFDPAGCARWRGHAERALDVLEHRGPDDHGWFEQDQVIFGHRRLSIVDMSSAGHQPMLSDDGQVALIFNGQIYNYLDLKAELERKGHRFRSRCDTEVALRAYLEYGPDCFELLRGMWAILIWDSRSRTLIVSRDRIGLKPLYRYQAPGGPLVFSSEIGAILAAWPEARTPDILSVYRFVTRAWQDFDERTFFSEITSVRPATTTTIDSEGERQRRFWSLRVDGGSAMPAEALHEHLADTVRRHTQSDLPVAIALSGGLDSGAIACLLSDQNRSGRTEAFSVTPPDTPDESDLVKATVAHSGVTHQFVDLGAVDYVETLDDILRAQGEPIPKVNHLYQYLLRKQVASRGYKVLLAGEGADEVFGGYAAFAPMYLAQLDASGLTDQANAFVEGGGPLTGKSAQDLRAAARQLVADGSGRRLRQRNLMGHELFRDVELYDEQAAFPRFAHEELEAFEGPHYMYREMLDRFRIDMPMVLRIEDRNGMANSLEVRSPFLDHTVVEAGFAYPEADYMAGGRNKVPLRKAIGSALPGPVINAAQKFRRPGSDSHVVYRHLAGPLMEHLSDGTLEGIEVFRADLAERFQADFQTSNADNAFIWFRLYNVARWARLHLT